MADSFDLTFLSALFRRGGYVLALSLALCSGGCGQNNSVSSTSPQTAAVSDSALNPVEASDKEGVPRINTGVFGRSAPAADPSGGRYQATLLSAEQLAVLEEELAPEDLSPDEEIIEDQSFAIEMPTLGLVWLVASKVNRSPSQLSLRWRLPEGEYIALSPADGPGSGQPESWRFWDLQEIAFEDVNRDGVGPDIITIAEYVTGVGPEGSQPFSIANVYFNQGTDRFLADATVNNLLSEQGAKTISDVNAILQAADLFSETSLAPQPKPEGTAPTRKPGSSTAGTSVDDLDLSQGAHREAFLKATLVGIEAGMPYAKVRSHLISKGWIPHTFETTAPKGDVADPMVDSLVSVGFEEAKKCSHPDDGFCRFEFVYKDRSFNNGPVLSISTKASGNTNEPGLNSRPLFWSYSFYDPARTTYLQQTFSQALLTELRDEDSFCLGFARCEAVKYSLKDALLLSASSAWGSTKISLIPREPITKALALGYAKILDVDGVIDLETPTLSPDRKTESYFAQSRSGKDPDETGMAITLSFTPDGQVSDISFKMIVL